MSNVGSRPVGRGSVATQAQQRERMMMAPILLIPKGLKAKAKKDKEDEDDKSKFVSFDIALPDTGTKTNDDGEATTTKKVEKQSFTIKIKKLGDGVTSPEEWCIYRRHMDDLFEHMSCNGDAEDGRVGMRYNLYVATLTGKAKEDFIAAVKAITEKTIAYVRTALDARLMRKSYERVSTT